MGNRAKRSSDRLGRVLDRLAEYVQNSPGGELLEDARRDGRDPAQTTSRVKGFFWQAVKNYQQTQMETAQREYERELDAMKSRHINLPKAAAQRRSLLGAIFSQQPQLKAAFTFQSRGFAELTDQDVENHLRKLALLGVLDEVHKREDDD